MSAPDLRLRSDALEWREIDGEIVALDLTTTEYLTANHAAAILWQELATGCSREDLVEALRRAFDLETDAADRDVDGFLAELRGQGLLV